MLLGNHSRVELDVIQHLANRIAGYHRTSPRVATVARAALVAEKIVASRRILIRPTRKRTQENKGHRCNHAAAAYFQSRRIDD